MSSLRDMPAGGWAADEAFLLGTNSRTNVPPHNDSVVVVGPPEINGSSQFNLSAPPQPHVSTSIIAGPSPPAWDGGRSQLECLAAIAYLVGSPLQRSQPTAVEPIQRSMTVVRELLRRGVDPEQIVRVIETREGAWTKVNE